MTIEEQVRQMDDGIVREALETLREEAEYQETANRAIALCRDAVEARVVYVRCPHGRMRLGWCGDCHPIGAAVAAWLETR